VEGGEFIEHDFAISPHGFLREVFIYFPPSSGKITLRPSTQR